MKSYTLKELSEISKVKPRTIRFYISKKLLPPPIQRGRNSLYSEEHLKKLEEIKELKKKGLLLREISLKNENKFLPNPESFVSYKISDDVIVVVKSEISPWRMKKIKDAIEEMYKKLNSDK